MLRLPIKIIIALIFAIIISFLAPVFAPSINLAYGADDEKVIDETNDKDNAVDNSDATSNVEMEATKGNFVNIAELQGLNKITAKTSKLAVEVGKSVEFGELEIIVHKCWLSAPDQRPESKILVEIYDHPEGEKKLIFYGWMFASTPSISSLEHPIYDVVALNCKAR